MKEHAVPGILVGVDGSAASHEALEWAAREASYRHAALTVLTVYPVAVSFWTGSPIYSPADLSDLERVRQAAPAAVTEAIGRLSGPAGMSTEAR